MSQVYFLAIGCTLAEVLFLVFFIILHNPNLWMVYQSFQKTCKQWNCF